jgi:hypothetical protein
MGGASLFSEGDILNLLAVPPPISIILDDHTDGFSELNAIYPASVLRFFFSVTSRPGNDLQKPPVQITYL